MSTLTPQTQLGGTASVPAEAREALKAALGANLLAPGDAGYDAARTIWNAMIDRKPGLIVRARGAADVITAVKFAAKHRVALAVKGGGHNIAGNAVNDGGLMLDLSLMKSVRIDPVAKTARVEPGALLADFDREAQAFGLVTPLGINSTTGVSGFTLGGGFGWTARKFGLTIDNLISADVVLADGRLVHVSEKSEPDLFWAIRGGGGNFGVVTSFEYRLHKLGPDVLVGLVVYPAADAKAVLAAYRKFTETSPDELTPWFVLRQAPPLPFIPAEWHGKDVVIVVGVWIGEDVEAGRKPIEPLRNLGAKPIAENIGPVPFAAWQQAFDPLLTPGARNYWKSHSFKTLTDPMIAITLDAASKLPSPECEIFVGQLGAQVNRVSPTATAYPHREVEFMMNVHTRWREASEDAKCIGWARGLFDALTPHATGGVYVNFMPQDETDRVKAGAYGPNYERLAKLKAKYDPTNLFRQNQNITPAG